MNQEKEISHMVREKCSLMVHVYKPLLICYKYIQLGSAILVYTASYLIRRRKIEKVETAVKTKIVFPG